MSTVYIISSVFIDGYHPRFFCSSLGCLPFLSSALIWSKIETIVLNLLLPLCQVGFSHSNILRTIIKRACLRFPALASHNSVPSLLPRRLKSRWQTEEVHQSRSIHKVFVIFGGDTSERQVSLMSGTNVWLNLQAFDDVRTKTLKYLTVHHVKSIMLKVWLLVGLFISLSCFLIQIY